MSILKRKIKLRLMSKDCESKSYFDIKKEDFPLQKMKSLELCSPVSSFSNSSETKISEQEERKSTSRNKKGENDSVPKSLRGTKIVRNYAKALCTFAYSELATGHIRKIIDQNYAGFVDIEDFRDHIKKQKGKTASISSLRDLLMENDRDNKKLSAYKKIFTEISIIFIKFFAVNWIFSGKIKYRLEHLRYRHKMLRRIQNPQHFTYLKS